MSNFLPGGRRARRTVQPAPVRGAVTLLVLMLLLAACNAAEKPYVIEMTGTNTFVPSTVVVPQGATVVWKNRDYHVHSTVSGPQLALHAEGATIPHAASAGETWDAGEILPGGSWARRFDTPGTHLFACPYHPGMVGTVVVSGETAAQAEDEAR